MWTYDLKNVFVIFFKLWDFLSAYFYIFFDLCVVYYASFNGLLKKIWVFTKKKTKVFHISERLITQERFLDNKLFLIFYFQEMKINYLPHEFYF